VGTYKLVLDGQDPETQFIVADASFEVPDVRELLDHLGFESEDFDENACYDLDESDVDYVLSHFDVAFEPKGLDVVMRSWHHLDDLPYKVHTERELPLMLAGSKPLAAFCDMYLSDLDLLREKAFKPYVESGRIIKRETIDSTFSPTGREIKLRTLLYALPGEEWRIDAYLLLWKTAGVSGWNDGFERMQGSLLGYEDWQNDAFMKMRRTQT
jgi:hypothetical protein